ncbi:MAG TPA: GGDEF and EAL domain-containing protein [Stellaceae bacterium]|nr:GGDEF and EAL domain-containing protein [Stellaceae bacterium]
MTVSDDELAGQVSAALRAAGDIAYSWELEDDKFGWSGRLPDVEIDFAAELGTGRSFASRIHPDDLVHRQLALAAHFDGEGALDCEYRLRDSTGAFVWVHERGRAQRDEAGRPHAMLGVIRAVGDRKAQQTRLERLANYDELTGHFNKSRLREAVDQIIATNQRSHRPAAFLSVGVDNMTLINDMFGYEAADTVLIEIGRRLDTCLRVSDLIGRLGGDRFGIVLSHCPQENITAAAEKILGAVNSAPVNTARGPIYATVSIGSASFPDQGLTSYDVITRAESALAEAKRAGRDCHTHYRMTAEQRERQRRSLTISEQVQAALREERVMFAFQPVVDAETGIVDHYECLLRMIMPDGRVVSAGEFVPVIEQLGFIRLVDHYVLERAIAELTAHPNVKLGFNISGLTAADRPWLRALISQVRNRPEIASRLIVEITETAALYDLEESARFVSALRHAGCSVSLDDFGAGHTSLRHLQNLAVDTVKIDGSFIRNLAGNPDSQVFLRHLLGLAKGFGFHTVAECVATAEDAEILRREGVGLLQGYYFGRPSLERPWLANPTGAPLHPKQLVDATGNPLKMESRLVDASGNPLGADGGHLAEVKRVASAN